MGNSARVGRTGEARVTVVEFIEYLKTIDQTAKVFVLADNCDGHAWIDLTKENVSQYVDMSYKGFCHIGE